jgi:hypothetical protein
MRKLQYSITISLLMVVITFMGPQMSVLWLLGPGESLAMLFLGGSFFMTALGSVKKRTRYDILFIIFLILASLTKESFLIAVPGMIFLKIWIEKNHFYSTFSESLRRNYLLLIPLAVILIELAIIKFYVGTGYAGLDKSLYWITKNIVITSLNFGKSYFNLLVGLSALIMAGIIFRVRVQLFSLVSFVLLCLIILPNIILYSNYGLTERYLLPSTFALGFFISSWVNSIGEGIAWFRKAALILFLPFIPLVSDSYTVAKSFTNEGIYTNELLKNLSENFNAERQVLVVADPVRHYEMSASLMTYMKFDKNAGLYGFPLLAGDPQLSEKDLVDGWKGYFHDYMFEDLKSPPGIIIFLDKDLAARFFLLSDLDQNKFDKIRTSDRSPFSIFKEKR